MAEEGGMILSSKGISDGGRIPRKYTQDGQGAVKDVSPPLEWYSVPEETVSLAIIMEDPDSPDPADPSPNPFVHWYRLSPPFLESKIPGSIIVEENSITCSSVLHEFTAASTRSHCRHDCCLLLCVISVLC